MQFIQAAHTSSGSNLPPTRVVIHATCPEMGAPAASAAGQAVATADYFQSPDSGGSAHYVVDVSETVQCVAEDVIAWHAPPDPCSLGIEICADGGSAASFSNPSVRYTRDDWLSPQVWPAVAGAAALCRQLCDKYGIPLVQLSSADLLAGRHGICGHADVSEAWHESDHDDPGPDFPWPEFMNAVKSGADIDPQEDDMQQADWERMERLVTAQVERSHVALREQDMQRIWAMLLDVDARGVVVGLVRAIAAKLGVK